MCKTSGIIVSSPSFACSSQLRTQTFAWGLNSSKRWISRLTEGVSIYAQTAVYEERLIRYGGHSEHGAPQRRTGSGDVPGEGIRGQGAASEVGGGGD